MAHIFYCYIRSEFLLTIYVFGSKGLQLCTLPQLQSPIIMFTNVDMQWGNWILFIHGQKIKGFAHYHFLPQTHLQQYSPVLRCSGGSLPWHSGCRLSGSCLPVSSKCTVCCINNCVRFHLMGKIVNNKQHDAVHLQKAQETHVTLKTIFYISVQQRVLLILFTYDININWSRETNKKL